MLLFCCRGTHILLFLPGAPDQTHWFPALENYCCTSLLQGVLRDHVVLQSWKEGHFLLCCGSVPSQFPIPTQGAARGGRERVMLSKHLRADSTPGDGSLMASELYCLHFKWWSWQPPPHTNWVGVPFCGCLAWQALATLLDKWFHWPVLLQQSAELSGLPRLSKRGFHVNLGRSTAKIAAPWSASDFCKCHYFIVGLQLRFPVKLHWAYSKSLLHHKQAVFKFIV